VALAVGIVIQLGVLVKETAEQVTYRLGQLGDRLVDLGGCRGADLALADQLLDLALQLRQLLAGILALVVLLTLADGLARSSVRSTRSSAWWSAVPCWRAAVTTAVRLASAPGTPSWDSTDVAVGRGPVGDGVLAAAGVVVGPPRRPAHRTRPRP
jgi:hypothetical protein